MAEEQPPEQQPQNLFVPRKPHRHSKGGTNWTMWAVLTPIILALVGWMISIESRASKSDANTDAKLSRMEADIQTKLSKVESVIDVSRRLKNVEDVVIPMAVDWRVAKELAKYGITPSSSTIQLPFAPSVVMPPGGSPSISPTPAPSKKPIKHPSINELESKARTWVEGQINQRLPNVSQQPMDASQQPPEGVP